MSRTVRAIDVGYSWTKYVVDGDHANRIRCRAFPSIAPRASGRELAVDGISLVTTYRDAFAQEARANGVDGLIRMLTDKNATLARDNEAA